MRRGLIHRAALALTLILGGMALGQARARYPGDIPAGGTPADAPPPRTFVCYGDSIMAGACSPTPLCEAVGTALAGSRTSNEAVSGYTPAQIKVCYEGGDSSNCLGYAAACGDRDCGYVLLNGGVNKLKAGDAVTGEVEAQAVATMFQVVDDILANTESIVVLFDVLPYATCNPSTCPVVTDAHLRATEYNRLKAAACTARANNPRLKCITSYAAMEEQPEGPEDPDPPPPGALSGTYACADDLIHLKQAGTDFLGCQALTALGFPCP